MGLDASSISSVFVFLGGVEMVDRLFLPDILDETAVVVVGSRCFSYDRIRMDYRSAALIHDVLEI